MPAKQSIVPLWKVIQGHLGLSIDPTLEDDQKKILQGLSSIIDGIGAYRTPSQFAFNADLEFASPLIDKRSNFCGHISSN